MTATPSTWRRPPPARGRCGARPGGAGGGLLHRVGGGARIAPPGRTRQALAPLPVAALRIDAETATQLARLGLRRVDELAGQPRAALARRFGTGLVRRLDQALGVEPEPVSPARPPDRFAVRLTLPEPIGLESDILAAIDRLLPQLSQRLTARGRGARRVRLQCFRADGTMQWVEVGLARPSADPERLRPLLAMKVGEIEAGFGIDAVRIEAHVTEPVHAARHKGGLTVTGEVAAAQGVDTGLDDLIGRLGARVGLEAITRLHPADSHIPEKGATVMAAAWSAPAAAWPATACATPPDALAAGTGDGRSGAARAGDVPVARRDAPAGRGVGARADRAGMVARRARLALGRARLLAGDDRGGRPDLALLRPRGGDERGLVLPREVPVAMAGRRRPATRDRRAAPVTRARRPVSGSGKGQGRKSAEMPSAAHSSAAAITDEISAAMQQEAESRSGAASARPKHIPAVQAAVGMSKVPITRNAARMTVKCFRAWRATPHPPRLHRRPGCLPRAAS